MYRYLLVGFVSEQLDQTALMRRLVWIHAGRKCIMLVLSWRGSFVLFQELHNMACRMTMIIQVISAPFITFL
jgi:hypothetical protein